MKKPKILASILLAACSIAAWGQGFTASVLGTVTDNTGAVVPQATITVTNLSTGSQSVVNTRSDGTYTAPQLTPGTYRVTAEVAGFKREVREPVTLQVDQRQTLDFKLEVGQVSENVTVSAEASQLQAETATVGTAVTSLQTSELPLNGRNFIQLNLLVPGASPPVKGSQLSTQGGSIEVHGLPENANYFWVDGVDNTTQSVGQYVVNVPPYSIEEFRVMSPTYDTEFGRTPGAQINVITRSGGNAYHGDAYLFIRNSVFDAKNFFDPAGPIPAFRRGQYGGDVGGKIIRDKLFFYGAFEGLTFAQGESASNQVPTHQETLGNFSDITTQIKDPLTGVQFPGNIIPASRLNPTGLAYAAYYPPPNSGTNTLLVSPTGDNTDNVAVGRVDYAMSTKNRLSFRYAFEAITYHQPIAQFSNQTNIPGFGLDNLAAHDITTGLSDTYSFTPSLVAEVRAGWNRFEFQYHAQARDHDYCAQLNIQGCDTGPANWYPPSVSLNSVYSTVGGGNNQYGPFDTTFFTPTLIWVKGKHTLKFGYDYHYFFDSFQIGLGPRGTFTFRGGFSGNPLSDLLLGLPYQATKTIIANQPNDARQFLVLKQTAGFAQDDFRVSQHLTLNIGLRYEYAFPGTDQRNHMANLDLSDGVANAKLLIAGQNGVGAKLFDADHWEFAPRFGFAWSPKQTWAVRGGYGIFYQMMTQNQFLSLHNNAPFQNAYTIVGDGKTITINNALVTGLVANVPAFTAVTQQYKAGMVQQFSIGVQHAFTPTLLVDAGYVGNRGRDLDANIGINTPTPGPGAVQARRPNVNYANINYFSPQFASEYDGLEVRLEKRLSRGIHFLASYTYSRALDNAGTPQDPRNLKAQWGPSNYDIPQHLAFSYVYELPFGKGRQFLSHLNRVEDALLGGWQLNGIVQINSGQPFTPILATDNTNTQQNQDRPNQVGDPFQSTPTCQTRTPNCWVNSAAYVTPALYTFGTAPKNGVRGPDTQQWDSAVAKNFALGEHRRLEFRAEAFNLLNRVNFDVPSATLSSTFGRISTAKPSRQMQFGLRFVF